MRRRRTPRAAQLCVQSASSYYHGRCRTVGAATAAAPGCMRAAGARLTSAPAARRRALHRRASSPAARWPHATAAARPACSALVDEQRPGGHVADAHVLAVVTSTRSVRHRRTPANCRSGERRCAAGARRRRVRRRRAPRCGRRRGACPGCGRALRVSTTGDRGSRSPARARPTATNQRRHGRSGRAAGSVGRYKMSARGDEPGRAPGRRGCASRSGRRASAPRGRPPAARRRCR